MYIGRNLKNFSIFLRIVTFCYIRGEKVKFYSYFVLIFIDTSCVGVRMSIINSVSNISTASPIVASQRKNVNFKSNSQPVVSGDIYDSYLKAQQQERKKQKMNQTSYYAFLGILAGTALVGAYASLKSIGGMGKGAKELKQIWQDVSKSAKAEDLALPKSLLDFTKKFKNGVENPKVLKERGGKPIKSVLLYGPPGTGKTTYAKALAQEFPDAKFAALDVTSLGSEYRSVSERNLNKAVDMICQEAEKNPNKKYFVFIDEIDSVMMEDRSLNANDSNKILNEFKKCFTEKLGKHENIVTIGATNIPIDVQKGIALNGKKLDKPMLDRFSEKVLVDLPTAEQIKNSVKFHYKNSEKVCDALKTDSQELNALSEFLANKSDDVSFRTLDSIYDATASAIEGDVAKVELVDILKSIKSKQVELKFTDADFAKLLSDLKVTM